MSSAPTVTVKPIPAACTVQDVCEALGFSRRTFYTIRHQLRDLGVLVPQVPQLTRRPMYLGEPIARFLSADGQARQLRKVLRAG